MIGWSNVLQHGARNMEKRFTHFGNRTKMKKRIKHNDLLPWFTMTHDQLPASYLKSTKKFFDELQATSNKQQATSSPQLESKIKNRKV